MMTSDELIQMGIDAKRSAIESLPTDVEEFLEANRDLIEAAAAKGKLQIGLSVKDPWLSNYRPLFLRVRDAVQANGYVYKTDGGIELRWDAAGQLLQISWGYSAGGGGRRSWSPSIVG